MSFFGVLAVLITLAAVFGFVNERTVRLPTAIGVTLASLGLSLGLIALHELAFGFDVWAEGVLDQVAFDELVMEGMLSFLLFSRAWGDDRRSPPGAPAVPPLHRPGHASRG